MYMLKLKNIDFEKESYNLAQSDEEKNKILFEILELNELIDEINQVSYQNHKKKIFNYRHNIDIFSWIADLKIIDILWILGTKD